jgi:2,5-diamino-6-(ribosylamino)-4(3H)-pyrimidinone 5'-phosphate reductase
MGTSLNGNSFNEPVLRLFPEPQDRLAVEDVYGSIAFPTTRNDPSASRPYVVVNMVSSLDGKVTASGKAGSIGSPTDRLLMRTLRSQADAVMIGAGTLRAEKLTLAIPKNLEVAREARGLRPQPLAVLATASGDLPLEANLLGGSSPDNLLVLASPETPEGHLTELSSRASVEVVPEAPDPGSSGSRLDLARALETLKKRYAVDVLLVEGGPVLNHALVINGLADELFLTLAPKLLGGLRPGALTMLEGPAVPPQRTEPELISVHLFGDELFLRYALRPPDK